MTRDAAEFERLSTEEKRARLATLLAKKSAAPRQFPLSFAQERLWFLAQLEPNSSVYNVLPALRLKGRVDRGALERSLTEIVRRHATLRTSFREADGQVVQVVAPAASVSLPVFDLRGCEPSEREGLAARRTTEEAGRPFDLQAGPLFRPVLFQLDEQDFILLLTLHHIISDGWSLGVFLRELTELYDAHTSGREPRLAPLPIQYTDYAAWQRERADAGALDAGLAYWRSRLSGLAPLELPSARTRPATPSRRGGRVGFNIAPALGARLRELCRAEGVTPFMALLAAFDLLLLRYTGQRDMAVGVPAANRGRSEVEGLIGCFINTLVLRTDLSGSPDFRELLARVRETCVGAYQHQEVPFERVVEELQPEREVGRSPFFQVMFDVGVRRPELMTVGGVGWEAYEVGNQTAKHDLTVSLNEVEGGGWEGTAEYNSDLFDGEWVERFRAHYERLLWSAVESPSHALGSLPMLSEGERCRLLRDFNPTAAPPLPPAPLIHELFARQARLTPSSLAVTDSAGGSLTYAELAARSSSLAHRLRRMGAGVETRVGVCVGRRSEMVAALLGVLGAGAAYVPLDPAYPAERLRYMLEDSGASLVVTDGGAERALAGAGVGLLRVEEVWGAAAQQSPDASSDGLWPSPGAEPSALAYVIYTSGSTGAPKGVAISHAAACSFLAWAGEFYAASDLACVLASTSVCFDLSVFELFAPLAWGGRVHVAGSLPEWALAGAGGGVTLVNSVPSVAGEALSAVGGLPSGVRVLNLAGEALTQPQAEGLLAGTPGLRLYDLYGPSEATTYATGVERVRGGRASIGRALRHMRAYVLDVGMEPVPEGVAGELYVGGEGLARGYLGRPGLTAERFVPDPHTSEAGGRMYRTGDVARHLSDGSLEYLGRSDSQVKVRGYRVELGEVETALVAQVGVRAAAVAAKGEGAGRRLVAYVVAESGVTAGGLVGGLRERMPEYMVPGAVVMLEALPLTPSGKVDRRALPEPDQSGISVESYVAPQTELEQKVACIWQEVLGVEKVGLYNNFFELGGHSLLLVRIHGQLQQVCGKSVSMVDLFRYPTVSSLVGYLSGEKAEPAAGEQPEAPAERQRSAAVRRRLDSSRRHGVEGLGSAIAVVGMQCRFPGTKNVEEFWRNLREGRETITFFTDEELREAGVNPEALSDPNYVKAKAMLEDADLFDAGFFGFTPREAEIIDPQHRLFLECVWEALEAAGYDPGRYAGRIGVFAGAGMGSNNYLFNLYSNPELVEAVGTLQTTYANDKDFLATRVSYKLNLKGPSLSVQTACSTSLVAVHLACQSLLNGECEMALAGGVSVGGRQKAGYIYQDGGTVSPDGHCRVFDARAEGTVFGNGAGVVLLKRLEDALADGDTVHAVIRGSAVNNDGAAKVGFTAPSVDGQSAVIEEAQAVAGVEPRSITYVETHGTGTRMGDPIEMAALTQTFRASTHERGFCAVGSVKSNFGHLDAAAGVAGLMKTVLALKHAEIPPSLNFERPNPEIDFANSPFFVNTSLRPWEPWQGVRRAGVSAFGIGGTNAHLVLEEAPRAPEAGAVEPPRRDPSQREPELLLLSARSSKQLEEMTRRLAAHLRENEGEELADVGYTLAVGRREMNHRRAVVCEGREDAITALESADPRRLQNSYQEHHDRPVVFMFPGGGAQYAGMGRGLYERCPEFREEVDRCSEILMPQLGIDLRHMLYPAAEDEEAAAERLRQTATALPALFVTEYATARQWMAWGVRPWAMIGHSLGEYVAACIAGVFSLEDALRLVAERGRLMQTLPAGAMLSVSMGPGEVESLLAGSDKISVAAVNGPSLCVLSGELGAIDEIEEVLTARGADVRRLHIDVASHSAIVTPVLEEMGRVVRGLTLRAPRMRYVSNVTGTWVRPEDAIDPDYWVRHLRQTVRFAEGVGELMKEKGSVFLEAGPGQTLSTLVRQQPRENGAPPIALPSLRHPQDEQSDEKFLLNAAGQLWLAGVAVDWEAFHSHEPHRRVALPTYCFERSRYWVEPRKGSFKAYDSEPRRKPERADWFYLPSWSRTLTPSPRRAEGSADSAGRQERWLLFTDRAGLGGALAARLAGPSREVLTVTAGGGFEKLGGNAYQIDPAREEDYVTLIAELAKAGTLPSAVAHLWNVTPAREEQSGAESLDARMREGYFSLIYLARAWARHGAADELKLLVVSNRLHDVSGEEHECPEKATLLGPCRVIPQEYTNVNCRSIDVSFAGEAEPSAALLEQLADELLSDSRDGVVAYRGLQRWVQTFERARLEADAPPVRELRPGGVYLITGGLGKVGLTVAGHVTREVRARLALLSRSPMPERGEWQRWLETHDAEEKTAARIKQLLELEAAGAELLLVNADVADEMQMRAALARVAEFGELRGVFHAAGEMCGDSVFRPVEEVGREDTAAQLNPKARGLLVLDKLLGDRPLDFMLVVSSNASALGGLGLAAHTAANAYAEALTGAAAKSRPYPLVTTNWDAWRASELRGAARAGGDEFALSPAESHDALMRVVRQARSGRVIVSAGDLPARLDFWVGGGDARPAEAGQEPDAAHERPEMANDYVAPRDDVERAIAGAWQYLLGIDRVGIYDNFFELGGHSLLATRLLSRIRDMYRVEVPMRKLFESPVVASLAEVVGELSAAKEKGGDAASSPAIGRAPRVARRLGRAPLG